MIKPLILATTLLSCAITLPAQAANTTFTNKLIPGGHILTNGDDGGWLANKIMQYYQSPAKLISK